MVQTHSSPSTIHALAQRVALRYAELPQVEAVALGGSRASEAADASSDIDLYVFYRETVSLGARRQIATPSTHAEIGNDFWEPGDEWTDAETGVRVDVMFRHVEWIRERLDVVLNQHRASVGYSTCFWYNILNSQILFDRQGWFMALQRTAERPYARELKRAVIAKNFPILRRNMSSYVHQIELAIARDDLISVNHRVTALLASYFDILFAVNEQPHPGEKRLAQFATRLCPRLPGNFPRAMDEVLTTPPGGDRQIVDKINALLDGLESLLREGTLLSESGELTLIEPSGG
jgi:hypothetical protein